VSTYTHTSTDNSRPSTVAPEEYANGVTESKPQHATRSVLIVCPDASAPRTLHPSTDGFCNTRHVYTHMCRWQNVHARVEVDIRLDRNLIYGRCKACPPPPSSTRCVLCARKSRPPHRARVIAKSLAGVRAQRASANAIADALRSILTTMTHFAEQFRTVLGHRC
jgi:hypothetical protein